MPYTALPVGSDVHKMQIMVGTMCTLSIFACLLTMSIFVPLADLAEPPTTDKERQALETLQCRYRGVIGELMQDRITRHPHMLTCHPALSFPLTDSQFHGALPTLARLLGQVDDVAAITISSMHAHLC
jgi:hypothetical protein